VIVNIEFKKLFWPSEDSFWTTTYLLEQLRVLAASELFLSVHALGTVDVTSSA